MEKIFDGEDQFFLKNSSKLNNFPVNEARPQSPRLPAYVNAIYLFLFNSKHSITMQITTILNHNNSAITINLKDYLNYNSKYVEILFNRGSNKVNVSRVTLGYMLHRVYSWVHPYGIGYTRETGPRRKITIQGKFKLI